MAEMITDKRAYRMKSGYDIPVLGLGTWELVGEACERTLRQALELGYRHIDTAELYDNEAEIGRAIEGMDREELFITSKVSSQNLAKNDVLRACERSLGKLGTDYVDLYLVHWPNDSIPLDGTFEAMQQLVDKGQVRSVGVSNFGVERLKKVFEVSSVPICNLQIEYHPLTKRDVLPEFCRQEDIVISAYSPLARGDVLKEPVLKEIGEKYDKTSVQVSLRWLVQRGAVVIPKSSSKEHLEADMDIFDWELLREDMNRINDIKSQKRLVDTKYT